MWLSQTVVIFTLIAVTFAGSFQGRAISTERTYITYYLYNNNARGVPFESNAAEVAEFDTNLETVVLIPSHEGNYQDEFSNTLRSGYSDREDVNLIIMEWAYLASGRYEDAVNNVNVAAGDLVRSIEVLRAQKTAAAAATTTQGVTDPTTVSPNQQNAVATGSEVAGSADQAPEVATNQDVHLIGFGLGAHLAGNVGKQLRSIAPIGRITGLDPTAKSYEGNNRPRLSSTDAVYVEVIHTSKGLFGTGIGTAIGDVDIFVNGGEKQPGCSHSACNHRRAYELYAATLRYDHYARRCTSMWEVAFNTCKGVTIKVGGAGSQKSAYPGIYRCNTGSRDPFV